MSDGISQGEGMKKQGWCSNVACVIEQEVGRPRGSQGRTIAIRSLEMKRLGLFRDLSAKHHSICKIAYHALFKT